MLKGKTTSGFEFVIEDDVFDNWELSEAIVDTDNGQPFAVVNLARQLLGQEQLDKLKEHCRESGKVSKRKMYGEILDMLKGTGSKDEKAKNV